MTRTPKDRTEAGATSAGLGAPVPAPPGSLSVACAEGGQAETTPAARATPVAATSLGGREPSRTAIRGGSACPVVGTAGQASTSPPEPPTRGSRGARGKEGPLDLGLPAARPRPSQLDGRGTQASAVGTEGSSAADQGGGPVPSRRIAGAGSLPAHGPAGGGRTDAPPAAEGLRGNDAMRAWQAALSDRNATARRGRARRPSATASPGVGRLRVAAPRRESFDDAPPVDLRLKPVDPGPEAA